MSHFTHEQRLEILELAGHVAREPRRGWSLGGLELVCVLVVTLFFGVVIGAIVAMASVPEKRTEQCGQADKRGNCGNDQRNGGPAGNGHTLAPAQLGNGHASADGTSVLPVTGNDFVKPGGGLGPDEFLKLFAAQAHGLSAARAGMPVKQPELINPYRG